LISSELFFVQGLFILIKEFIQPMKENGTLKEEDMKIIFF